MVIDGSVFAKAFCVPAGSPSRGGDVTVYMSMTQTNRACPLFFYSVHVSISVVMALSTVFHSIDSPDNSIFSLCYSGLDLCLIGPFHYVFMKVSFSPDIIPSG